MFFGICLCSTLSKISNLSPYIFTLVLKVRFHAYINQPRLYRDSAGHFMDTSCTDDARVKVPSIQKVTFFYNMKYSTETLSICIFVCLKMFLTAEI